MIKHLRILSILNGIVLFVLLGNYLEFYSLPSRNTPTNIVDIVGTIVIIFILEIHIYQLKGDLKCRTPNTSQD